MNSEDSAKKLMVNAASGKLTERSLAECWNRMKSEDRKDMMRLVKKVKAKGKK